MGGYRVVICAQERFDHVRFGLIPVVAAVIGLAEGRVFLKHQLAVVVEQHARRRLVGFDHLAEYQIHRAEQSVGDGEGSVRAELLVFQEQQAGARGLCPWSGGGAPCAVAQRYDGRLGQRLEKRLPDVLSPCLGLAAETVAAGGVDGTQRFGHPAQSQIAVSVEHELVERIFRVGHLAVDHAVALAAQLFVETFGPPAHQVVAGFE